MNAKRIWCWLFCSTEKGPSYPTNQWTNHPWLLPLPLQPPISSMTLIAPCWALLQSRWPNKLSSLQAKSMYLERSFNRWDLKKKKAELWLCVFWKFMLSPYMWQISWNQNNKALHWEINIFPVAGRDRQLDERLWCTQACFVQPFVCPNLEDSLRTTWCAYSFHCWHCKLSNSAHPRYTYHKFYDVTVQLMCYCRIVRQPFLATEWLTTNEHSADIRCK